MPSSPDGKGDTIHKGPQPAPSHPLSDASSVSDDRSERSILARHNLINRLFPPPVLRSPALHPREGSSSAENNGSSLSPDESLVTDGDALEKSWFRVVDQKTKISALRDRLSKARRQTRNARVEKDAVDNAFMSLLRPLRFTTSSPTAQDLKAAHIAGDALNSGLDFSRLQDHLDKMQETRHRCQASEMALETLEDELDIAQEELDHLERLLINDSRPGAPQLSEDAETKHAAMPESLMGLEEEPVENYHPLYMRFMLTLRDHGLAEERYHNHLARKAAIEDDLHRLELRQKYHQDYTKYPKQLDTTDLEFLLGFEKEEKKLLDRIERLSDEADSLREQCFKEGVVPRYAELMEIYSYYPWEFSVDPDPAVDSDQGFDTATAPYTTTTRFWILLSNQYHLLEDEPVTAETALKMADTSLARDPDNFEKKELRKSALKEFIIEHLIRDTRPEDKGNFINRWALHKLRISPGEVELMYSIFTNETGLHIHDVHRWQHDVLYFWPRDEAALAHPEQYRGVISKLEASSEGPIADSSLVYSDVESIVHTDEAIHSQAPSASSYMQMGDQTDTEGGDTAGSDNVEVVPHVPSKEPPLPLKEQDNAQSGTELTVAPEVLQTIEPEAAAVAPSEEPGIVHNTPSTQVQTFESTFVPESPSDRPHGVELEDLVATTAGASPAQLEELVLLREQALVSTDEVRVPSEELQNLESQAVLTSLSEAPPVPSQEPQGPESEAAHLASSIESIVSSEEVHTFEPAAVSAIPS